MTALPPDNVRAERSGFRCEEISRRHREWGWDCPAVDLDFVLVEYNRGKPVALVEYKEKHAQMPSLTHPTMKALSDLADNYKHGPLPFFIAFYCSEDWWFRVYPVNEAAKSFFKHCEGQYLSEQRFVKGLYHLRKRALEEADLQRIAELNDIIPVQALA